MKFSSSQLAYLVGDREARGNLRALLKYVLTLLALITLYAVLFHVIKVSVEGEQHSWITGFYWTLVVMTTLGFGDITFTSDIGRLFSIVVLLSGVVLLLVMLPFLFISLFYAPWLEARVRLRAPREVPAGHARPRDHHRVRRHRRRPGRAAADRADPYYVIEPDPTVGGAADRRRHLGHRRRERQQRHLRADQRDRRAPAARQLRGHDQHQHHDHRARDCRRTCRSRRSSKRRTRSTCCELSGATTVLPLKHQLGEYLANRVDTGGSDAHVIGAYRGLQIAELPARDTILCRPDGARHPAAGADGPQRRRALGARQAAAGLSRTRSIQADGVLVVAGTEAQIAALNALDAERGAGRPPPVLIIGAGKVGQAAARALKRKGIDGPRDRSQRAALEPMRRGRRQRLSRRRRGSAAARAGRHPHACRRSCSRPTTMR